MELLERLNQIIMSSAQCLVSPQQMIVITTTAATITTVILLLQPLCL